MSPYHAAAPLWLDAIIDPLDTRTWISMGIEASQLACRRHGQASNEGVQHGGLADVGRHRERSVAMGVPLAKPRVRLSAASPRSFLAAGFPLQSVTRNANRVYIGVPQLT